MLSLGDRTLFLSLVFDAKVTSWFTKNVSAASAEDKGWIYSFYSIATAQSVGCFTCKCWFALCYLAPKFFTKTHLFWWKLYKRGSIGNWWNETFISMYCIFTNNYLINIWKSLKIFCVCSISFIVSC